MQARYPMLLLALIALTGSTGAQTTMPSDGVEAITKPSGDVKLSFVEPGMVAKVLVKESQAVKAGDVLLWQDDAVRLAELEQAQAEASDKTRIEAAQAQLEQKRVDLKKLMDAGESASSPTEREHAKLDVVIAELQLKLEKFNQSQNQRKVKELQLRIDRMKVRSPIAGRVEQLAVKDGESVDALAQVIRVVNVDPLWVDVPMPMAQAAALQQTLATGKPAIVQVCFPDDKGEFGPGATCESKVVHVAQVADGGSLTRVVRIEVPNPNGRPAGEHVMIRIPTPMTARK